MNKDILTFEYIDKFKGILILLIVIGHIKGLTTIEIQSTLYSFHVTSFLFLPFLFNRDKISFKNLVKIFRRYFVPYSIFFLILFFTYHIMFNYEMNVFSFFHSYIFGTAHLLRDQIGISAYWFFPALIFLLIILMIYNTLIGYYKNIFVILMFVFHLFIGVLALPDATLQEAPFNLYVALYLFTIGMIVKYIIRNIKLRNIHFFGITLLFFTLLIFSYGGKFNLASPHFPSIMTRPYDFFLRDMIMISGFFSLLFISKYISLFSPLGKYSLAIYTIHPIIIQIVNKLIHSSSFIFLIIKLIAVLLITYGITLLIYRLNLNRFIYPR